MENKKESKTYAVIGILTFVFIMSLFILLGQKARAQEVGSGIPKCFFVLVFFLKIFIAIPASIVQPPPHEALF